MRARDSASVCISIRSGREDMPAAAVTFARDLAAGAQRKKETKQNNRQPQRQLPQANPG